MIELPLHILNIFGGFVGFCALVIATGVLYNRHEEYNAPYVAVLFVVGILLMFFALERPVPHALTLEDLHITVARTTMYVGVAYWEFVIVSSFME